MKAIEKPQVVVYTTLLILLALIALIISMSGCVSERIDGNRDLATEQRSVLPFSEVVSSGSFRVTIIPSGETRIQVKAESNLLPYLVTNANGTTLTLRFTDGYRIQEHYPVEVFVYTPVLQSVRLSGSGSVACGSFSPERMYVNISGSGNVTGNFITDALDAVVSGSGNLDMTGFATTTNLMVSGSGNINVPQLQQESCTAFISGSGSIIAFASNTLNATISGSGNVFYLGSPAISTHITGSGSVKRYQ
jgi:hypothetical protein